MNLRRFMYVVKMNRNKIHIILFEVQMFILLVHIKINIGFCHSHSLFDSVQEFVQNKANEVKSTLPFYENYICFRFFAFVSRINSHNLV